MTGWVGEGLVLTLVLYGVNGTIKNFQMRMVTVSNLVTLF